MKKDDIKDIIKWIALAAVGLGGGSHIKDFTTELYSPLLEETKRIRFNQKTVIYNQHVEQYQREGKSLDEAIELANEH